MKDVPSRVLKRFQQLKREEAGHIELKQIRKNYYVYRATSEWDKERRKVRKITEYMGSIDSDGIFTARRVRNGVQESSREVFEFGNGGLARYLLQDVEPLLTERTPYARELIAAAIVRAIDPKPLRLVASRWEKLYLSKQLDIRLAPKHLSTVLRHTGEEIQRWYELFAGLATADDLLLYDLTAVFTQSQNIRLAERGYNADHAYLDQIGVILAFSCSTKVPVGVEVFYGSLKDITTFKDFIERLPKKDLGFIFDRGFSSFALLGKLRKQGIHYIVPLRKNATLCDLRWLRWKGTFLYRERPIRWGRKETEHGLLYAFEDPQLRGEEEKALLKQVEAEKLTMADFEAKRRHAGVICILSDLDKEGIELFDLYKGREDVELAFDAMKNELESDKTYLRSDEAVRGYFFVTFLALRVYFKILQRLREKGLTTRIAVDEVLFELSKVMKIVERSGREYFAQIPKRAREMCSLFPEALPMG